jgi:hypothetical protein
MTNKELTSLLKLCQKYGVKRVKMASIELELETLPLPLNSQADAMATPLNAQERPSGTAQYTTSDGKPLTDDDVLMWSAGN